LCPAGWSFTIARSTNANTSLDGRQGSSKFFSQRTQTCSANLVRMGDGRPQLRRQRSLRRSTNFSALCTCISHAGLHPFLNKSPFELSHRADDLEHQPARRSREVEVVAETHEIHAQCIEFGQGINKIAERSTESIPNQNYFETTSVRIDEQSVKLKASVRGTRNADVKGN
jgi:hypothetical protein